MCIRDSYGIDILKALQLRPIPPDEVNLTPKMCIRDRLYSEEDGMYHFPGEAQTHAEVDVNLRRPDTQGGACLLYTSRCV